MYAGLYIPQGRGLFKSVIETLSTIDFQKIQLENSILNEINTPWTHHI